MFPEWIKVNIIAFPGMEDTLSELGYEEFDPVRYGDLNRIITTTKEKEKPAAVKPDSSNFGLDDADEFERTDPAFEVYVTFVPEKFPVSSVPSTQQETPDIGLLFGGGRYLGHGLGPSTKDEISVAGVIHRCFGPLEDTSFDYDAMLDIAIKEVYETFVVNSIADSTE